MAALLLPSTLSAETWTLNGKDYEVERQGEAVTFDGVTIYTVTLSGAAKQKLWYCVADLTKPGARVVTYNPENIRTTGTTVPAMAQKLVDRGFDCRVGINADLYSTYGPIGSTISGGEIIKIAKTATAWRSIGIDNSDHTVHIGNVSVNFGAKLNGKQTYAPTYINVPRATGEMILYTSRWGANTATAVENSLEVVLEPAEGIIHSDRPTTFTVKSSPVINGGSLAIPAGCVVLSTNSAAHIKALQDVKPGDIYEVTPSKVSVSGASQGHAFVECTELIGGDPLLVVNSARVSDGILSSMPNWDSRRPRTAIGTDATHTKLIFAVVDGDSKNSGVSAGMNAHEIADLMINLGCVDALNFDGGGSSCIWTKACGKNPLNNPSDSNGPRAVRNGLFIVYDTTSGVIPATAVDNPDAPVEYFNLQGVKVDNPAGGLYIRRQGNQSSIEILNN